LTTLHDNLILFLNARGTHLNGPIQLPVTSFGSVVSFVGETMYFFHSPGQKEFDHTSRQPDNVHQKETLLKKLIRKGHHSCELFLQELARSGYEEEVNICLSERTLIVVVI
jgi:hypothetical protein